MTVLAMMSCLCFGDRYVMSDEMSLACATYAHWLDDSTQVSAKDLVQYLIFRSSFFDYN